MECTIMWKTYIYEVYNKQGELIYYGSTSREHKFIERKLRTQYTWSNEIAKIKFRLPVLSLKYEKEMLNRLAPKYHPSWIATRA